ncbi:hypothetical protein BaRGS_00037085 [Batillaria attramentaria]|uniref:Uncharacterized protein n=1 Tax=Batillaria attramentaria TaxID=370345 RepID=A0ABD0J9M0_9CAEN
MTSRVSNCELDCKVRQTVKAKGIGGFSASRVSCTVILLGVRWEWDGLMEAAQSTAASDKDSHCRSRQTVKFFNIEMAYCLCGEAWLFSLQMHLN